MPYDTKYQISTRAVDEVPMESTSMDGINEKKINHKREADKVILTSDISKVKMSLDEFRMATE